MELQEVRNQREELREEYGFAFERRKGEEDARHNCVGDLLQMLPLLQGARRMHKMIKHRSLSWMLSSETKKRLPSTLSAPLVV